MILKLYKERIKAGKRPKDGEFERSFNKFKEIYDEHGVRVIGVWENVDDPYEGYLVTAYRDNAHYEETVAKLRANSKYKDLTKDLEEYRESIEVTTLKLVPGSPEC